jgi:hypothetical protein
LSRNASFSKFTPSKIRWHLYTGGTYKPGFTVVENFIGSGFDLQLKDSEAPMPSFIIFAHPHKRVSHKENH